MKILVLAQVDFAKPYGAHTRPFFMCKYLHDSGHELRVLCNTSKKYSPSFIFEKLKSLQIIWPFSYLFMVREVILHVRAFKPSIMYAHSNMFTIVAHLARRLLRVQIPLVFDVHGSWALEQRSALIYPVLNFFESVAVKVADRLITASEDLRLALVRIYKIQADKLISIPNGVDLVFHPVPKNLLRTKLLDNDVKTIVFSAPRNFISNIIAIKFMYEVMRQLGKKDPRIILLITGGGPIVELNPPNVIYTGFVDDLKAYLLLADVAVAPYPKEAKCGGARNKVLEYFACKIPVISTKEGIYGIDGALPDEHFIFAEDDPADFARKILAALNMPEKKKLEMIEKSYRLISTEYSWEKQARKVRMVFDSLFQEINSTLR